MSKIKVFLGGYINSTNAQNLNCLALAKYLDKEKFEIYALEVYSGNLPKNNIKGVKTFRCFKPFKISRYLGYLWGIYNCDIAYLPKREIDGWNNFWLKFLKKKSFTTVESVFDEKNLKDAIKLKGSYKKFVDSFKFYNKVYSITKFLKEYNYKHHKIQSEDKILYLGTEVDTFLNLNKKNTKLKNVVFVGRLLKRKGIYEFIELAKIFNNLNFHIVGEGEEYKNIQKIAKDLNNIKLYGILNHQELSVLLKEMDLHLFPSRSEGFPKVTLETAAAGIPSLVYSDYGANEWITHYEDGFVVDTLEDMKNIIQELIDNPKLLEKTSKNAIKMAKRFDWKVVVKDWENEIAKLKDEK